LARLRALLLRERCSCEISRRKSRRARASARIAARWACSTMVSAGDSSTNGAFAAKAAKWTG
jgi:hypothetical protein